MNRSTNLRNTVLAAALALGTATTAQAGDWRWTLTPYAWATDVGVDVAIGDETLVDEEISVQELLEDIDTLFQARLETQKGELGFFGDLFDVTLSEATATIALPQGAGDLEITPEMGMTILDLGSFYDPNGDQKGFQLLYGARIMNQRAELALTRPSTGAATTIEIDDTFVDALVGFRYIRPLGQRFSVQMQADVSKGGTELTWSAGPTFAYAFGESGRYAATVGYRRMVVDFETADAVDAKMTLSGALAGLRIAF
jgi:hypothetical protein